MGKVGRALSVQRLAQGVCAAIAGAYVAAGREVPKFGAHSARGVTSSASLYAGVPMEAIMSAASWTSEHCFIRHYMMAQTASVAGAVLDVAVRGAP